MRLSVIIPCYGSEATVRPLVEALHTELAAITDAYEVILVVDGSPDGTATVARDLAREAPDTVRTIVLRRNYGQHNALMAGIVRAAHPVIVTMDDDLQHRPDQIATLIAPLQDPSVDLVYGVPTAEEHGIFRSAASRVVKAGLSLAGVPNARDVSAFRAFRTELREGFDDVSDPFVSIDVVLSWTTTGVRAAPVVMDHRTVGRSGYTFGRLLRHSWNMVTGYGTLPLALVSWLGFISALTGTVAMIAVLVAYSLGRVEVAGFTTVVALIGMLSGAVMVSIGVIGQYIGRLHFRSMHRPSFVVRTDSRHEDRP